MLTPYIAELKRNSLDDGPGIRTAIFFKGCPLACVWCHNPECIAPRPELLWRKDDCLDCRDCATFCPSGAVPPDGPREVDRDKCARALLCVDGCPSGALEVVGRRWELGELVELLARDAVFYANSGGGVTLTGGEATLYMEYAGELARQLKERGIHLLLETCGQFDARALERHLLSHLDTIYFDLKLLDADAHREHCGRDNATILANLDRLLAQSRVEVLVRIPLVPEITATPGNLAAAAAFLRARGVARVALLPYNPLWPTKAAALGRPVRYPRTTWMTPAEKSAAAAPFAGFKILGLGDTIHPHNGDLGDTIPPHNLRKSVANSG